jgi:V/A-type H+/Na+-transporting ATPase subunit I
MRHDVKKFLFAGLENERDLFFKRAQEAGIIHFIHTKPVQTKAELEEVKVFSKAIAILRGLPVVEQEESVDYENGFNLAKEIVAIRESLEKLYEEERMLGLEISRVEPFGDFSREEIAFLEKETNRKIQFFCAKQGLGEQPENVIHVSSDHGLDYFLGINKDPVQYPKMIEMVIDRSWGELKQRETEAKQEIHALENNLKNYAKYHTFLHHAFIHEINAFHLQEAKRSVDYPVGQMFVVQGWVPEHKMEALNQLVKEMHVFVEEIGIDPNETVPTFLENQGAARIGEDLVHIYDTPSQTDKDPSFWVLVSFALFFSMIIGDGGYGLVLLLIAFYFRYKHSGLKNQKKRALDLLTILGFGCIVWGVLTTSFFGINIAPDNPIRKASVMSWLVEKKTQYHIGRQDEVHAEWVKKYPELSFVKEPKAFLTQAAAPDNHGVMDYEVFSKFSDNILMELALLIGVVHIILSMGRNLKRNWSYFGWILLIVGGYLYTPFFLNVSSIPHFVFGLDTQLIAKNALYMIYGGFGLATILALFQHKWLGLLEPTIAIQIFGDILSYMRLYALGLSGALLTQTVVDLAASVPLVFGVLILIMGHAVNIVLGVMGGVIHGLRLNFLEWYHYSFEGGGKMFNPLRKQEIE